MSENVSWTRSQSNVTNICVCGSSGRNWQGDYHKQILRSIKIMRYVWNLRSNYKLNINERSFKRKKFKLVSYSLTEENNFTSSWDYYVTVERALSGCVISRRSLHCPSFPSARELQKNLWGNFVSWRKSDARQRRTIELWRIKKTGKKSSLTDNLAENIRYRSTASNFTTTAELGISDLCTEPNKTLTTLSTSVKIS